ncbi:MAG TPA: glycosyltransferase family 4 protein [Candidatus Bathyarchaeia archaeon]|nr:glycosyltransferase family 4 protein [Candidatus Bathyarchaeia archaeon]
MFRIQVLANHFLSPDILGGGDRVFIELCRNWQRKGVEVSVACPKNGKTLCESCGLDADYEIIPGSFLERAPSLLAIPLLFIARALNTCVMRLPYGKQIMLYTPGDFICNVIPAAFLRRVCGDRATWAAHVFFVIPPPFSRQLSFVRDVISFFLQRLSFSLMRRYADLVIVLNSTTRGQLIRCGIPEEKIFISSGGVDLAQIEAAESGIDSPYDACFVGRIHPGKGVLDLAEIWEKVVAIKSDARLAIVGSGSPYYVDMLVESLRAKNIARNVDMLGFRASPFGLMKSSKILLYPDHEAGYGWGLAVCEALACGIPVVAYDLPVYREFFQEGMSLVRFRNTAEFAKATLDVLDNDSKRKDLGRRGKDFVRKYDWKGVSDTLLSALEEIPRGEPIVS